MRNMRKLKETPADCDPKMKCCNSDKFTSFLDTNKAEDMKCEKQNCCCGYKTCADWMATNILDIIAINNLGNQLADRVMFGKKGGKLDLGPKQREAKTLFTGPEIEAMVKEMSPDGQKNTF